MLATCLPVPGSGAAGRRYNRRATRWSFRFTLSGTDRDEFMCLPPTGKRMSISGVDNGRFADGKGVELWASMGQLGILQQLGVVGGSQPPRLRWRHPAGGR
jgi:hypothetical protein